MQIKVLAYIFGIVVSLTGLLVPSSTLFEFLIATPVAVMEMDAPVLTQKLLIGFALFKAGLVISGILIITLANVSFLKQNIQAMGSGKGKREKVPALIMAALLLTAFALRVYRLDNQLWYDEFLVIDKFMHLSVGRIIAIFFSDNNHILYTLLAKASTGLFGESPWSLRLPAVFFGTGSVWALYLFGRSVSTTRAAVFSAVLLAFSYQHIWFSQNARGYTALLFMTLITSWLLVRGLRERRSHLWLLYAFFSALGAYTHMTMLFVTTGQLIIYLILLMSKRRDYWPERWRGLYLGFLLAGFLTLQLYAPIMPQIINVFTFSSKNIVSTIEKSVPAVSPAKENGSDVSQAIASASDRKFGLTEWKNPFWTIKEFIRGIEMSFSGSVLAIAAITIFTGVFSAGLLHFLRRDPVVIFLLFFPVIIGTAVVITGGYPLFPRFYFFSMGFIVLIAVQGTLELDKIMKRRLTSDFLKSLPIGTALCSVLILVSASSLPAVYAPKQDYLGAISYIQKMSEPGDAIVTVGLTSYPYRKFYNQEWKKADNIEELNSIRSQVNRTWLLYTLPLPLKSKNPEIMDTILRDFEIVKQFPGTLNGGTIYVCRSDTPPSAGKIYSTKVHSPHSIPQNGIYELSFKHSGIYDNNFFDVSINAVYSSPTGIQFNVKGFYYGDDIWKVRFSPDEIGTWAYRYVMTGKGGFSKEGDGIFETTTSGREGRILLNPKNPHRWIFSSGKPYFPVGIQDCIYIKDGKLQYITIDGIEIIDKVKRVSMIGKGKRVSFDEFFYIFGQAGFNLLRFSQRNCSYSLYGDLDHFHEDESIATDNLLTLARKHGFRVMFGFFGYHGEWPYGESTEAIMAPNDYETVSKEKRFIDYCIARWGAYVDFWELLNERNASNEWISLMTDHVRSVDPSDRPISTNYIKPLLTGLDFNSPHWYDFESIFQSDLRVKQLARVWKQAGKPVIVGEHGNLGSNWETLSGDRMRIRTWTALFQEISFVFWHTGLWYTADTAANIYLGSEERQYIRVLQDFSSNLDAEVRMIPMGVSIDSVRTYGLLSDTTAAAYLHHFENHDTPIRNAKIKLNLPGSDELNKELIGEWIDPSSGKVLTSIGVSPGHQTLDVPAFTVDIALIVTFKSN